MQGKTALQLAQHENHEAMVELLKNWTEADKNASPRDDEEPLIEDLEDDESDDDGWTRAVEAPAR